MKNPKSFLLYNKIHYFSMFGLGVFSPNLRNLLCITLTHF
ncbi:hypothetical protein CLOSTMETH_02632 [[Clostridium] methylpentosum DSM 5476]|uniref:Uncharacterized protein n=1 Tax=[Clostridium] methylpentosum DSM 5476 TaxID=537013 RepID=C0EFJ0_9FIRM|nr:hypothetical protein CLOSTMETH_02632 [[Clostridium] methylpentosum DSM 5476]